MISCCVHVWRIIYDNDETWGQNSIDIRESWHCPFSLKNVIPQFSHMGIAYPLKQRCNFILLCINYNNFVNNQDQNISFVLSHMTLLNHPYRHWSNAAPHTTYKLNSKPIASTVSKVLYHMHNDQLFKM